MAVGRNGRSLLCFVSPIKTLRSGHFDSLRFMENNLVFSVRIIDQANSVSLVPYNLKRFVHRRAGR